MKALFVSSPTALREVYALQAHLEKNIDSAIWAQVRNQRQTDFNSLEAFADVGADFDCCIILLTRDDFEQARPRAVSELMLEIGFFVGAMGGARCVLLLERATPSNMISLLKRLVTVKFTVKTSVDLVASIKPAAIELRAQIRRLGKRNRLPPIRIPAATRASPGVIAKVRTVGQSESDRLKPAKSARPDKGASAERNSGSSGARIFLSYSHRDIRLKQELERHLEPLKRAIGIKIWTDGAIMSGSEWEESIRTNLNDADVVILLVSASFLASEFCYSREMMEALRRHDAGTALVLPIILRPADWQAGPISKIQVLPRDGKAITTWKNPDTALLEVVHEIRNAIEGAPKRQ
ncbi:MAG: TIR domain-containing protein [Bryobacteraceae bacterium]